MQRLSSALLAIATVLFGASVATAQDFDTAGEQQMLARINAMRAAQQLRPLSRHDALDAAARAHSTDMAAQHQLTHVSPTTGTPADRVRRAGVAATTIAENVALHRSSDDAHQALLGSEAHRANMMSPDITHVGLGALRTEQGVYLTQIFAAIAPPAPPPAPAPVAPPPAPAAPPPPLVEQLQIPLPPGLPQIVPGGAVEQSQLEAPIPPPQAAPVARPPLSYQVQVGSNGTVVIERTPDQRVHGYWVFGSNRWWYYPMPAYAQPGQRLAPDLSVSSPPPGFPAQPFAGPQPMPMPRPMMAPPMMAPPPPPPPQSAQIIIQGPPGTATFYAVPPPPLVGNPDRAWRTAQRQWERDHRRWLRDQQRMRRDAL